MSATPDLKVPAAPAPAVLNGGSIEIVSTGDRWRYRPTCECGWFVPSFGAVATALGAFRKHSARVHGSWQAGA